jgi:hypothetical protein
MPLFDVAADAELFAAVHRALVEQVPPSEPEAERRNSPRQAYRYVQLLAPCDGRTLPTQEDYARVFLYDLSPNGFSYLADQRPKANQLIAALGRTPFKFFVAEVVNQRLTEQHGKPLVQVGCRFVKRL